MGKARPIVIHPEETMLSSATPVMEERMFFDRDGHWVGWGGWIRNEAGDVSGWHHHADCETFVYIIRGSLTVEFGPGGSDSIVAHAGNFVFIPPNVIHRETTGKDFDLEAFVLRAGREPEQVNVSGPGAARG